MTKIDLYDEKRYLYLIKNIPKYLIVIFSAYIVTLAFTPLQDKNAYLIHTIMELFCIFIGISTFFITWHSYRDTLGIYREFGFGLLASSIFYSFHTFITLEYRMPIHGAHDLAIKFWAIGMLVESLTILDLSLNLKESVINKWKKLFLILLFSFGFSFALIYEPEIVPALYKENEITTAKLIFDCLIIVLCILSLHNLKYRLLGENKKSLKYIYFALMFIIPSQLSFTRYDSINGLYSNYAHILRVIYYYYLYRAVYGRSIEFPYEKLEEAYTEKENATTRIKEISETLNDTLDALPVGILKLDRDNGIKYMNKSLEEILACDRNDFYGLKLKEFYKSFPTKDGRENMLKLLEDNVEVPINSIIEISNLKNKNISLSINSQKIGDSVLVYINEVKKQQEIYSMHLQTKNILNALSNAILIVDKDGKIILYNDAFNKIFEIDGVDIIGMGVERFNSLIDYTGESVLALLKENRADEHPHEINICTLKGKRIELLNYIAPITNVENETIGMIIICTDITEIKMHQHNIQQQEKLALIGQMAAGIVHEIKNPLATIKGLSQLISAKTQLEKIKEYSAVIDSAIDEITNVVNEFLGFAKPKPAVTVRTSINKIVESMQLLTETQCYTKNIRCQFYYSQWSMEITADEMKIKQVMLNITENAIFAMENSDNPELIIITYYDTDSKEGVIKITDNGIGMSTDVLGKIGNPFFTTKEKGTGLGLGISYEIMREHKGRIEVESREGKGSTFKIIFTQIEDLL